MLSVLLIQVFVDLAPGHRLRWWHDDSEPSVTGALVICIEGDSRASRRPSTCDSAGSGCRL